MQLVYTIADWLNENENRLKQGLIMGAIKHLHRPKQLVLKKIPKKSWAILRLSMSGNSFHTCITIPSRQFLDKKDSYSKIF